MFGYGFSEAPLGSPPQYAAAGAGAYTLTADGGSLALTGNAVGLYMDRVLTAAVGTYSLAGINANLLLGVVYSMSAGSGSFALTGIDVAMTRSYVLSAQGGTYAQAGRSVSFIYSGGSPDVLFPLAGLIQTFPLAGQ